MVPAMDRTWKTLARWSLIGPLLAVVALDLGCAKLWSQRREEQPAKLGMLRDSSEIYAGNHRKPGTTIADPLAIGSDSEPPMVTQATEPEPLISGRAPSASVGVPNASLLLASAERRGNTVERSNDPARLVAEARSALDRMTTYEVLMHRQERVNGTLQPEEDVVLAIRRDPKSVRLTWPSGPHKGREVLYRADEPGGLMHVNMADSALPIPRLSIPPDSPMVMRNSRHPVTEAGFDSLVVGLEEALKAPGDSALKYVGLETPATLDQPHHCLIRKFPSGEVNRVYLDPKTHLPVVFAADSANGEILERYVFRDVRPNLADLSSASAFDPNARWGPPRGLFGRVARGNGPTQPDSSDSPSPR